MNSENPIDKFDKLNTLPLSGGCLYIVATPIGNLGDITLRAIEVLKKVDVILTEDTRHSLHLLKHYSIEKKCVALHEHNELKQVADLINELKKGLHMALISDAGTPLINDPGYPLVREALTCGIQVVPIPGPSALIAALSASGLPTDHFCFQGFLPSKDSARQAELEALAMERRTMVFYEAPHRVLSTLKDMARIFGNDREVCLARELTKSFETIRQGSLQAILELIKKDLNQQRGEIVLVLRGFQANQDNDASELPIEAKRILKILMAELPPTKAASIASKITGKPKKVLYDFALKSEE